MNRRQLLTSASALCTAGLLPPASAQIQGNAFIISGFPAGGMGDFVARPLAEYLRGRYASNVLVEAKPGAGGRIAIEYVKRAAADGTVLLQMPSSPMVLYPHTYRKLSYDPLVDFIPVTSTVTYPIVFTAGPGLPAEIKNVKDYLDWAKANSKQANYGVPALGSALHFAGMLLERASGVELKSVAYRGGAPLLQDLLGGQVPVSFNVLGEVLPHIRSGRLRALATANPARASFLPDVPTLVEQSYKDIALTEHLGLYAPARTPTETVSRLNALVREALRTPEMIDSLAKNGLEPLHQSPEDYLKLLRQASQHWGQIAKTTGFTAED